MNNKVLFEKNFVYDQLNEQEGDYYLNLLLHTSEITNPKYTSSNLPVEVNGMYLKKERENYISFNGTVTIENENRYFIGSIEIRKNKIYIINNVHRFTKDENVDYEVCDIFQILKSKVKRTTLYQKEKNIYSKEFKSLSFDKLEELKLKATGKKI